MSLKRVEGKPAVNVTIGARTIGRGLAENDVFDELAGRFQARAAHASHAST